MEADKNGDLVVEVERLSAEAQAAWDLVSSWGRLPVEERTPEEYERRREILKAADVALATAERRLVLRRRPVVPIQEAVKRAQAQAKPPNVEG